MKRIIYRMMPRLLAKVKGDVGGESCSVILRGAAVGSGEEYLGDPCRADRLCRRDYPCVYLRTNSGSPVLLAAD